MIAINDYSYASIDYNHDPDMAVPPGCTIGVIGKLCQFSMFNFLCFAYIQKHIFGMSTNIIFLLMTYIRPERLVGFPRYRWRTRDGEGSTTTTTLENVTENLTSLTSIVPATQIEDMP